MERRDVIKALGVAAGVVGSASPLPAEAPDAANCRPENPYQAPPGTGISMPPYYKPTPSTAERLRREQYDGRVSKQLGKRKEMCIDWPVEAHECPLIAQPSQTSSAALSSI